MLMTLLSTSNKQDVILLQQETAFAQLSGALQKFIIECSEGHTKLEQLIQAEAVSAKEHTSEEHNKTRSHIKGYIDGEHHATRNEVVQKVCIQTTAEHEKTRGLMSEHLAALSVEENVEHARTRDHVSQRIDDLRAATLSKSERDKFRKSLNFQGRDQRVNDLKDGHSRTFQWLFEDSQHSHEPLEDHGQELDLVYEDLVESSQCKTRSSFTAWLKSTEKLYWISAKPGAGKSTLMKFLSSDPRTRTLLEEKATGEIHILTHFFYLMGGSPM